MATSPYRPPPDPNDPIAHPNTLGPNWTPPPVAPPPPVTPPVPPAGGPTPPPTTPPVSFENTPQGRWDFLQQFKDKPWYNAPLFDSYLASHPDWTANVPYWTTRFTDAPGQGSNAPATPKKLGADPVQHFQLPGSGEQPPLGSVNMPGSSDLMSKVMAELDAQEQGGESPRTRQMHLRMLQE